MKTSLLALTTAFALTFGATATGFAQDATNTDPATPEECLVEQGAGATPPGESLATETDGDDSDDGSDGNGPDAIDDQTAPGCEDVGDDTDN